jgi:NAD(P)-dependent dehydrogenase (short-subunit alcohol dehydrogenase family)
MVKSSADAQARVVIVTGAGTGLGRAYALRLAADGLRVVVNNRRREVDEAGRGSADRVVEEIRASDGIAIANYDDVCDEGAGSRMVHQALEAWGRLDALVNNAGVDQHAAFHRIGLQEFRRIVDVNLMGTVAVTHAAWQHMREAGHGRVIVSTSSAGLHGLHGLSAYAASKAALIAFSRSLAAEGRSRDVLCNAIAPYAATRMTSAHVTDPEERRATAPELVAPLVAALVSERSRVNGEVFVVGRGWARHAAVVELDRMIRVSDRASADATSTQLMRDALVVPGVCREYPDGRASYDDFGARVVAQGLQRWQDAE